MHTCRTHETHNKISFALLCAQLLPIFWKSYSEFAANVQRTASALGVNTERILSVCIAYMLKSEKLGHILVVFGKFGKRISIGEA